MHLSTAFVKALWRRLTNPRRAHEENEADAGPLSLSQAYRRSSAAAVQRTTASVVFAFAAAAIPPLALAEATGDGDWRALVITAVVALLAGGALWWPVRGVRSPRGVSEPLTSALLTLALLSLIGALPFYLQHRVRLSPLAAVFESVSGLTSTGLTELARPQSLSAPLLLYRAELPWMAGLATVLFSVLMLPTLRIGGLELYRRVLPGSPRAPAGSRQLRRLGWRLVLIYAALTFTCALAYRLCGLSLFDALVVALSTVSTGGFLPHGAGLAAYHSRAVDTTATFFMLLGSCNFLCLYSPFTNRTRRSRLAAKECLWFIGLFVAIAAVIVIPSELNHHTGDGGGCTGVIAHITQVAAFVTTTGFARCNYSAWAPLARALLVTTSIVGACSLSTGGGLKVFRWSILFARAKNICLSVGHPYRQVQQGRPGLEVPEATADAVYGLFLLYVASFAALTLALIATGLDASSAFTTLAAALTNAGLTLSASGPDIHSLGAGAQALLIVAMLLGRLEVVDLAAPCALLMQSVSLPRHRAVRPRVNSEPDSD